MKKIQGLFYTALLVSVVGLSSSAAADDVLLESEEIIDDYYDAEDYAEELPEDMTEASAEQVQSGTLIEDTVLQAQTQEPVAIQETEGAEKSA